MYFISLSNILRKLFSRKIQMCIDTVEFDYSKMIILLLTNIDITALFSICQFERQTS